MILSGKIIIRQDSNALLVSLLNCLYEAQDNALCKYVGEQLRENVPFLDRIFQADFYNHLCFSKISFLPQDYLSIGYFLASIAVSYKGEFRVCLADCSLGDTGIKILTQSLCSSLDPHCEITGHLSVNFRRDQLTEVGVSYIAKILGTTRVLSKLSFEYTQICDKGLQYIAEVLTTNTSLIELNLSNCSLRIIEENGPTLTEMLQRNKTLRKLDLSCNKAISDNQASFIIEGLKKNTTLERVELLSCSFTDDCIRSIENDILTCTPKALVHSDFLNKEIQNFF